MAKMFLESEVKGQEQVLHWPRWLLRPLPGLACLLSPTISIRLISQLLICLSFYASWSDFCLTNPEIFHLIKMRFVFLSHMLWKTIPSSSYLPWSLVISSSPYHICKYFSTYMCVLYMIYRACTYTCITYIFIDKHTHIYVYVCIFNFIPDRICGDCIYEYRTVQV